ncbi:unnamed protein product [Malus baccata var. baccata]
MYRRTKGTSKAKAKSKSLAGQGSGKGKNPIPAQSMKLRVDLAIKLMKSSMILGTLKKIGNQEAVPASIPAESQTYYKPISYFDLAPVASIATEYKGIKDLDPDGLLSLSMLVISVHFPKHTEKKKEKKAAVKDSPMNHLKNVKAAADSLAQIQLEEKSTSPALFKEDKIPKCIVEPRIVSELPSSCPICTKLGHASEHCPWRRRLPFGVTQVGKGYEIYGRRVNILWCSFCDEIGHRTSECPELNKKIEKTRLWEEFFFPEDKDN